MEQDPWDKDPEQVVEWVEPESVRQAQDRSAAVKDAVVWAALALAPAETVYVPAVVKKCRMSKAFPVRR